MTIRSTIRESIRATIASSVAVSSGGGGGGSDPAPFQSVNADGWSVTYDSPPAEFDPAGDPVTFEVTRQGFNSTGTAVEIVDTVTCTKRIRQAYSSQASLTTDQVALSDYIYEDDVLVGATNGSSAVSPKPIANWIMFDRAVVGDSLTLQVVAFHRDARNGEQVACVEFTVSDGTTTITSRVSQSSLINEAGKDNYPIVGYQATIDISTLTNPATLTCNAKIYPHFGVAASVLDSSAQSLAYELSPRYFRRNTSFAKPIVVVDPAGNDSTGVASTNLATATASPCLTISGAMIKLQSTFSGVDGAEIHLNNGTYVLSTGAIAGNLAQSYAELLVKCSATATPASVLVTFGSAATALRLQGGWLRFEGVNIQRTGTTQPTGAGAGNPTEFRFSALTFDNNSQNAALTGSNAHTRFEGVTFAGTVGCLSASTTQVRGLRGCTIPSPLAVEGWLVVGCRINTPTSTTFNYNASRINGSIVAFNWIRSPTSAQGAFNIGGSADQSQVAWCQNVVEYTSATASPSLRTSADAAAGDLSHIVIHNNTFTGSWAAGRWNSFYDEGATRRAHSLLSIKGNLLASLYTKSDIFRGANEAGGDAASAKGNWPYNFGVGCQGNFTMYRGNDNVGSLGGQSQDYAGLGTVNGTSNVTRNDPLFVDDKSTTYNGTSYSAGAGGGDYSLGSGSPAKGIVSPILRFDLAGNARSSTAASAGAYE